MLAVRHHIINNQATFQKIIESKDFKDTFGKVEGEQNKRLPSEMQEAAEEQPLLYNKQFLASTKRDIERIIAPDCKLRPFGGFLGEVL